MTTPSSNDNDTDHPAPPLIWIDLEMSGLDPDHCRILEIASLVTDGELKVIGEGPDLVIHQPDAILDAMLAQLKSAGVQIVGGPEPWFNGRFAWVGAGRGTLRFYLGIGRGRSQRTL